MKRTKIQQAKTGEATESPETKSKKQSKKSKLNSTEKFYLKKNSKEIWTVIHSILKPSMSTLQAHPSPLNEKRLKDLSGKMQQPMTLYYLT